jgi:NitT/TauT family transport system permease protein
VSLASARGRARREAAMAAVLPVLFAVLALAFWQLLVTMTRVPEVVLPPPSSIARQFLASLPELLYQARFTGMEALATFVIATAIGVVIAAGITFSAVAREAVFPNLIVMQLIPKIALAPIFVIWLGVGAPAHVAFGVFVSFFPVALSAATGLANTDAHAVNLCRSMVASPWQIFIHVRIPFALPYLFTGTKIAATLVFMGVVVGEFISADAGLGFFILHAGARSDTPRIFAGLIMLSLLGLAFYGAVAIAERAVQERWRG